LNKELDRLTLKAPRYRIGRLGKLNRRLLGFNVSEGGKDYSFTAEYASDLVLIVGQDTYSANPGENVTFWAYLDVNWTAQNMTVWANVTGPVASSFELFDDGLHDDNQSGDGLFGAIFAAPATEGYYNLVITAEGLDLQNYSFIRQVSMSLSVEQLPNLVASGLSVVPTAYEGDDVSVTFNVSNDGSANASGFTVAAYVFNDAENYTLISEVNESGLAVGEVHSYDFAFVPQLENHSVFVIADIYRNVSERNTSDDFSISFLEVLPGGCSPTTPPAYGNWTLVVDHECHQTEFTVNGSLIIETNTTLNLYDTNLTILNGSLESGGNLSMLNSEVETVWP
jgi:hypothetical protein